MSKDESMPDSTELWWNWPIIVALIGAFLSPLVQTFLNNREKEAEREFRQKQEASSSLISAWEQALSIIRQLVTINLNESATHGRLNRAMSSHFNVNDQA